MAPDAAEPAASDGPLAGYRVGIVLSERDAASTRLADAAEEWLVGEGAEVTRHPAPAAFEVAQLVGWLAADRRHDALIACASIVRGETSHDRHLASAVTSSLLDIGVRTRLPVGNAVLTVETTEQAAARSGGDKGNRGLDAARAVAGLLLSRQAMLPSRAVDLGPQGAS